MINIILNWFKEEGTSMKLVTVFYKIISTQLAQFDHQLSSSQQMDSMDQAIARANCSQVSLFKMDYLE